MDWSLVAYAFGHRTESRFECRKVLIGRDDWRQLRANKFQRLPDDLTRRIVIVQNIKGVLTFWGFEVLQRNSRGAGRLSELIYQAVQYRSIPSGLYQKDWRDPGRFSFQLFDGRIFDFAFRPSRR